MTFLGGEHVGYNGEVYGFEEIPETPKVPQYQASWGPSLETVAYALGTAYGTFIAYENIHRAKGTPEADEKAERNHELATLMSDALASLDDYMNHAEDLHVKEE